MPTQQPEDPHRQYPHWQPLDTYAGIAKPLRKEYGVFRLAASEYANEQQDLLEFVLREDSAERVLDVVEVAFRCFTVGTARFDEARERDEEHLPQAQMVLGQPRDS